MPGRPKRKARLLREGKSLSSWSKPARSGAARPPRKVRLAHYEVPLERPRPSAPNHEIIAGHPSQAPKASPGRGAPFCATASVRQSTIAHHVGSRIARKHCAQLPPKLRPAQVIVTEQDENVGGGSLYTLVATWCDGGRLMTFIGREGS